MPFSICFSYASCAGWMVTEKCREKCMSLFVYDIWCYKSSDYVHSSVVRNRHHFMSLDQLIKLAHDNGIALYVWILQTIAKKGWRRQRRSRSGKRRLTFRYRKLNSQYLIWLLNICITAFYCYCGCCCCLWEMVSFVSHCNFSGMVHFSKFRFCSRSFFLAFKTHFPALAHGRERDENGNSFL